MKSSAPEYLTESYVIRQTDPRWQVLDHMAWLAKNVFNVANYLIRQAFFTDRKQGIEHNKKARTWDSLLNFIRLKDKIRREYASDYHAMPKRVTETTLKAIINMWRGYDASWQDWHSNPHKYRGEPGIPRYKKSGDVGRSEVIWNQEAIGKRIYRKQGAIALSGCDVTLDVGASLYERIRMIEGLEEDAAVNLYDRIAVVKVSPRNDHYLVTLIYRIKPQPCEHFDPALVMGIDMGVNNLMAITSNRTGFVPILVNGRPMKSINQYFNKKRAQLQSRLPDGQYSSQRLKRLYRTRSRRIKDYLHRASKFVVDSAIEERIGTIVIGQNKHWKQLAQMGKRNNQNFLSIPHRQLIEMIRYKAGLAGIQVICHEESYTSKCSFLDGEPIQKHEVYAGKRVKRGLFKTSDGRLINADVNASYNIMRKVVPNAFADGIEDVAVHPALVTV